MNTSESSKTTVGRPRSPKVNRTIIDAVLDLVGGGNALGSLSLVSIAARAGVSRNSIYRRWKSKEDLYSDVVIAVRRTMPDLTHYSARENLVALLDVQSDGGNERVLEFERAINAEANIFKELYECYQGEIVAPLDNAMRLVIRRGKETGEIRVDVDESLLTNVLLHVLARKPSQDTSGLHSGRVGQLVTDLVFDGVAPK